MHARVGAGMAQQALPALPLFAGLRRVYFLKPSRIRQNHNATHDLPATRARLGNYCLRLWRNLAAFADFSRMSW